MAYDFTGLNTTPATGAVHLFNVKTRGKANTWAVPSSSDGTTYFSASDGITTGSSGAGGLANANAWFRFQMPGSTKEYCYQRGSTNQLWRAKYSFAAGFTGGSPGISRVPSAADEVVFIGGGTDASPTFANLFGTADGGYRAGCAFQTASPWMWYSYGYPTGGGNPTHGMFLDQMVTGSYQAGDTDPYVAYADGSGSASCLANNLINGSAFMRGSFNGATQSTWKIMQYLSLTPVGDSNLLPNPYSGKDDVLPIFYCAATGANPGFKGQSTQFKFTTVGQATAHRLTPSPLNLVTTNDLCVIGMLCFPWDGSTPLV